MVHISPWDATLRLIKGAAAILPPASPFYPYGPYKRERFLQSQRRLGCALSSCASRLYFAWPISGIPTVRLSGPRSFFQDRGFAQAVHEVLRSGDQGVLANVSARNRATVKFELVASPPGGQTALQGPVRDASKRLPVLRMPEAARLKPNQMFA
jgi:hypothetical protein